MVVKVDKTVNLLELRDQAETLSLPHYLVQDAGLTQVNYWLHLIHTFSCYKDLCRKCLCLTKNTFKKNNLVTWLDFGKWTGLKSFWHPFIV